MTVEQLGRAYRTYRRTAGVAPDAIGNLSAVEPGHPE